MRISLKDLLSNFMTEKELNEVDFLNLSPEFILECCLETPGVQQARYLGGGKFVMKTEAGKLEFEVKGREVNKIFH